MVTFTIQYLTTRAGKHGATRFYWQPSAALKRAGWALVSLGTDQDTAIKAAQALNNQVADWKAGGEAKKGTAAARKAVTAHMARNTVGGLIAEFRLRHLPTLEASTQRTYNDCLKTIERWAGKAPIAAIDIERVETFQKELSKPAKPGGPERITRQASTMRVARTLFKWGIKKRLMPNSNPFSEVAIKTPDARDQIWPDHCIEAMVAAADAAGNASIGTAVLLAANTGQREGDILKLQWNQWQAGRIRLRQGKTRVWVGVRAVAQLRQRLDALADANRARTVPATTILTRETDGAAYPAHYFQTEFKRIKLLAIAAGAADLDGLQYRDLRRTCIVRLAEAGVDLPGIAAISGHQIESCKRILETYLPRTEVMADNAIDMMEAYRAARAAEKKEQQG